MGKLRVLRGERPPNPPLERLERWLRSLRADTDNPITMMMGVAVHKDGTVDTSYEAEGMDKVTLLGAMDLAALGIRSEMGFEETDDDG